MTQGRPGQPAVAKHLEAVQRGGRADLRRRSQAAVGHEFPRRPLDRSGDYPFSNGVIGKVIVYNMEERQRIKNTIYNEGTKEIEQAKVEERLRELGITIRLDSFVDQATEKKVANVIREMMVEKGFQEAKVEPYHEPMPGRVGEDDRAEVQGHRRAEGQDLERRLRRQHRLQRRQDQGPDEDEQGRRVLDFPRQQRLSGRQVRRRRRNGRRVLPRPRLPADQRRPARRSSRFATRRTAKSAS